MMHAPAIRRKACRALLLTPDSEILLIKVSNPSSEWAGWVTPGGGVESGESEAEGLRRELAEELGFSNVTEESKVWTRFHEFQWNGNRYEQDEVYFLIRTEKFQPSPDAPLTETEILDFKEMRWWPLDEIRRSNENFVPRQLADHLSQLISMKTLPTKPIAVGI